MKPSRASSTPPVLPILGLFALALLAAAPGRAATTLRVAVPPSTPAGASVHVAGDFQGWNPGSPAHALALQPDGRWAITLELVPGQPIQFKFTRGTWESVEKGYCGEELANRTLTSQAGATYDFTVDTWRDLPSHAGHVESFTHAPFLAGRRCWVYLPPGYGESDRRYPVLYMHDGQNLFNVLTSFIGCEWRVDEACEALIAAGEIEPVIVVGIENGGAQRCLEYTPWSYAGAPCSGGGGDAYLAAIRDVLIPEVDRRYLTRTGRDHTYLCGSSLGGLISAYAGYAFDATFGRIAAVSPSYWWDDLHLITYALSQGRPALDRFYQDMGTIENGSIADGDGDGIDDYIETLRLMRDVALAQGFQEGQDFLSVEAQGHVHNEFFWALRMPDLLRFLIGAPVTAAPDRAGRSPAALAISPHPVRGESRIDFTLGVAGRVQIDLVDVVGRRRARIADRDFDAGTHVLRWRPAGDGRLAPGIYWLRLGSGDRVAARKVVLCD